MASGENKLFIVEKVRYSDLKVAARFVFRTRSAAREFAKEKRNAPRNKAWFNVLPAATWGPEQ